MKAVEAFIKSAKEFAANGWKVSEDMLKSDAFGMLRGGVVVDTVAGENRTRQILSENLTLTPDNADKLSRQLALKQKLMDAIAVHETYSQLGDLEKSQRTFFAKCLFCGLYRKLPPKMYQLDGDEEGVKSFLLMSMNDYDLAPNPKDTYYAMYRKFTTLPEDQKATMRNLADRRDQKATNEVMAGDSTRYLKYIANAQAADAAIEKRMNDINMDVTYDHPEIIEFYQALRGEFARWLSDDE